MYLFWLGIVGMGAGSLYLFMMQALFPPLTRRSPLWPASSVPSQVPLLPDVNHLCGILANAITFDESGTQ